MDDTALAPPDKRRLSPQPRSRTAHPPEKREVVGCRQSGREEDQVVDMLERVQPVGHLGQPF